MTSAATIGAVTYAGVNLPVPTTEMDHWIERYIPHSEIQEYAQQVWPGPRLLGMTFYNFLPFKVVKLGSLRWPVGAMRWATYSSLVSDKELAVLRPICYPSGSSLAAAQPLVLDDGLSSITAKMFMLPPRHLTGAGVQDVWLLSLVDQRWFWWQQHGGVIANVLDWPSLYGIIQTQLGISIAFDAISPDYTTPQMVGGFQTQYEALPILFDAIAYNVGQRVVCDFNGVVSCKNLVDSVAIRNANVALADLADSQMAGGQLNFDQAITPG